MRLGSLKTKRKEKYRLSGCLLPTTQGSLKTSLRASAKLKTECSRIRFFVGQAITKSQLHAARQQTRIGGVAQKAVQHPFERGIFVLILHFLREKIGDDLRLLFHVELG